MCDLFSKKYPLTKYNLPNETEHDVGTYLQSKINKTYAASVNSFKKTIELLYLRYWTICMNNYHLVFDHSVYTIKKSKAEIIPLLYSKHI